ncbi:MAG: type III pantothenate kinase [Bacteroidia bacterium]
MLLAIDIGNTDGVFALHDGKQWHERHRIPSKRDTPAAIYKEKLRDFLQEKAQEVSHIMMGCVVPQLAEPVSQAVHELMPQARFERMGLELYPQLPLTIPSPHEIGEDIVANVLAAHHQFQQACIVIDFGTALTFVACSDDGTIEGVAIAPGLKTSIKAIFLQAAQLPEVPLEVPSTALGKNTIHALQSGILLGYESLVSGMIDRIEREMGKRCSIIATGGLSSVLTPLKHRFDVTDPLLTLKGLKLASELRS